jgi:hypothetical protein
MPEFHWRRERHHVLFDVDSVRIERTNGLFDGLIWPKAG